MSAVSFRVQFVPGFRLQEEALWWLWTSECKRRQGRSRVELAELDGEEDWPTDWRNVIIQRLKRPQTER